MDKKKLSLISTTKSYINTNNQHKDNTYQAGEVVQHDNNSKYYITTNSKTNNLTNTNTNTNTNMFTIPWKLGKGSSTPSTNCKRSTRARFRLLRRKNS